MPVAHTLYLVTDGPITVSTVADSFPLQQHRAGINQLSSIASITFDPARLLLSKVVVENPLLKSP